MTAALPGAPRAALGFERAGGRTRLLRQRVGYPFHVTRPFWLDPGVPELATLYLQSASGGLYRGDRLSLAIEVGAGAAAHVTTQAATVVHRTHGRPAMLGTSLAVAPGAWAALTADPFILFPGAELTWANEVTLAKGGCALLTEGFAFHDPQAGGGNFTSLSANTVVRDAHGRLVLADRGHLEGADLVEAATPLGPARACGSAFILGPARLLPDAGTLEDLLDRVGCLAGASLAPNAGGLAVRLLAADGGALRRGLDAIFALAFAAAHGMEPSRRRK